MNLDLNHAQRELLELIADGKRYEDAALLTGLSVDAMKKRGKHLMDALDAETLAHAVAIAFRHGLLYLYANSNAAHREEIAETAQRREEGHMCVPCRTGKHQECPNEECPCVCNDSGFKFKRGIESERTAETVSA